MVDTLQVVDEQVILETGLQGPPGPTGAVVGNSYVNVKDKYGLDGTSGDRANIQSAFDSETLGSVLFFPSMDYGTDNTELSLTRQLSLLGENAGSRISATFGGGDTTSATLKVGVTSGNAVLSGGDVRHMFIRNMNILGTNGLCALSLNKDDGALPVHNFEIEACRINGNTYGIVQGYTTDNDQDVAASNINKCTITNGIDFINAVDGQRVEYCDFLGTQTAITFDSRYGTWKHFFANNRFVSRDGAIIVKNGGQIDIIENTIEQGGVANTNEVIAAGGKSASIILRGLSTADGGRDFACGQVRIMGNNFGGSTNVDVNIWADRAFECTIEENDFLAANTSDIEFTANATDSYVGGKNRFRSNGTPAAGNNYGADLYGRAPTIVDSDGSNYGWAKGVGDTDIALFNSFTEAEDFQVVKDNHGIVHFSGRLSPGTVADGTKILSLPTGYRPRFQHERRVSYVTGVTELFCTIRFLTNGDVRLYDYDATNHVRFDGLQFLAA